ncbi:MAG: mevalonate kinase [Marinilabiliaceae bacterium]
MPKEAGEIFYSKIMLFGEYTIINGSMGLTIPYSHFNGQLAFPNRESYTDLAFAQRSNQHLYEFWYYLNALENNQTLLTDFRTDKLKEDLENGLYFESTIPEGYGLGSSGALVAAFFKKYVDIDHTQKGNLTPPQIRKLKEQLAQLETWFHGTSSGIDPLICYMGHPLHLKDLNHIEPVGLPRYDRDPDEAIFLLNSGRPGKTAPLVDRFMDRYKNDTEYRRLIDENLTPASNTCIISLINNDRESFYHNLKALSLFQLTYMEKMVPPSIRKLWQQGVETDQYYLKLCGSGGGGFILGFTKNYQSTKEFMKTQHTEIIPVYQDLKH